MAKKQTTEQQLQEIGVSQNVPQTIMNLIDKNRMQLSKVQRELDSEELVLSEETKYGTKQYINPKFLVMEKLQYLINNTTRNAVEIAQIIEKNRLRPSKDDPDPNRPSGVEMTFTNYREDEEEPEQEKRLSPKEQAALLKEVKRREMANKGVKGGNSD